MQSLSRDEEAVTIWAREFVEMAAISSQFVRRPFARWPNLELRKEEGREPNKQITELWQRDGRKDGNSNSSRAKSDGRSRGGWRNNGQTDSSSRFSSLTLGNRSNFAQIAKGGGDDGGAERAATCS